jgi:hypothetical protein
MSQKWLDQKLGLGGSAPKNLDKDLHNGTVLTQRSDNSVKLQDLINQ